MLGNKIKKLVGTMMLSVMVLGLSGAVQAQANNWEDTPFTFNFNNSQRYTSPRAKTDTSKVYMKCLSLTSGTSYTAHATGCSTTTSVPVDCSRGYAYNFTGAGEYHYMTSWVYEDGYRLARVAGHPNYGYSFTATGKWSPDNKSGY